MFSFKSLIAYDEIQIKYIMIMTIGKSKEVIIWF